MPGVMPRLYAKREIWFAVSLHAKITVRGPFTPAYGRWRWSAVFV